MSRRMKQIQNQRRNDMVANGHQRAPVIGSAPRYSVQNIPAPNAAPGFANMNVPGGAQTFVIGGLTKLEHAAIEIGSRNPNLAPTFVVETAAQILNACNNYAQAPDDEEDEDDVDTEVAEEAKSPSSIVIP